MKDVSKKNYTLKPVTRQVSPPKAEECFRDITEDDDGYHPYADVPDTRPLFERDPWD